MTSVCAREEGVALVPPHMSALLMSSTEMSVVNKITELHCEWALSKLNLSQRNTFVSEMCISSSVKFFSVYPMDLYSIYCVERWLKCVSYQKLLSLEITLIFTSFQSPLEKCHEERKGE